jgi:hypothetical protein
MNYEYKKTDSNIVEVISLIRERPQMFFGENSIDIYQLYYYLLGYNAARISSGIAHDFDKKFQFEFNTWVYKKYDYIIEHNTFWPKSISVVAEKTGTNPATLFFELFDEFNEN